ncbi:hypothetical protein NDU88_004430 [Pleurodeles waltl]|uniref:RNase H type-1 domain-containing protein n=1 Tax=Pleurodeles waltl TaxID=8319 RepID=A0AAV7NM74_PLEWA|nr:hypothetical protein NDU88_004430 [Pleurodeles waltl]
MQGESSSSFMENCPETQKDLAFRVDLGEALVGVFDTNWGSAASLNAELEALKIAIRWGMPFMGRRYPTATATSFDGERVNINWPSASDLNPTGRTREPPHGSPQSG